MDSTSKPEDPKKMIQTPQLPQQSNQVQVQIQVQNPPQSHPTPPQSAQIQQLQQPSQIQKTSVPVPQQQTIPIQQPASTVQTQPTPQVQAQLSQQQQPIQLQQQPQQLTTQIQQSPQIQQLTQSGLAPVSTSQSSLCAVAGTTPPILFQLTHPRGIGTTQYRLAGNASFGGGIQRIAMAIPRHPILTPRATILQQPTLIRGVTQQGIGLSPVIPTGQPIGLRVQTSMAGSPIIHQTNSINTTPTPNATTPSQMTPKDALAKGTSFFQSLLTNKAIGKDKKLIKEIIQDFIDCRKTAEEFAIALQQEMNSAPQNQLVPFLHLLLPHIRQALDSGTIKLPGIRGPNQRDPLSQAGPAIATPPQQQKPISVVPSTSQPQLEESNTTSSPNKVQSNNTAPKRAKKLPLPPGTKSKYAIRKEQMEARRRERMEREAAAEGGIKTEPTDEKKALEKPEKPTKTKSDKPRPKIKKQEKQLESLASALRDDDDVNDVAAMGGVNLAEESQRIMASGAELVGTQIRSCKDEPFLDTKVLSAKITKIAKEYNLSEPSKEVVTLISHATQERLKNMVERLGVLADHRSENLKLNPKYEISNDIKGQMKFLAELDRIEKRRYEEQERELLLRVAKSRSKVEDPEQQKLRQKAKDMQRAEQEEVRQREANETALLAIGPRKKMKTSTTSSVSSFSQSSNLKDTKTSAEVKMNSVRRVKRVNMRDLQVLLELDRTHLNRLIKITAQ